MEDTDWPFEQPRDFSVVTLRPIVADGAPILHVVHDADGRGWQFLSGGREFIFAQGDLVTLETIVQRDPSIIQLADLPPGWHAWRHAPTSSWHREPIPISGV